MRRLAVLALLALGALFAVQPAAAQTYTKYPKLEIFGGYSYYNTDVLNTKRINMPKGFGASVSYNLSPFIGLTADFDAHYGKFKDVVFPAGVNDLHFSQYEALFGPRFSYRTEEASVFGHVMAGLFETRAEGDVALAGEPAFAGHSTNKFAVAVGGGVDRNINRWLAYRVFQVDFIFVNLKPDNMRNFRVETGLLFRLATTP